MYNKSKYLGKVLVFIILCIVASSMSNPESSLNDLDKEKLKGKVKSVKETKYALKEKSFDSERERILHQKNTFYDTSGYIVESTLYQDGGVYLVSRYSPSPEGMPEEMKEYNPDGTLNLYVTYNYDDRGFRSEALYDWADNHNVGEICENTDYYFEIILNDIFNKVKYTNEYRGYCTEEHYVKSDGTLSFKIISKYDFHGNKTESGYYRGNGHLSWMTKYKYDRYNNLVQSKVFKSNRIAVLSKYKHEFDEAGNWIIRKEDREVHVNILTAGLERANTITEREIEYY
jgi:hypothetical protein